MAEKKFETALTELEGIVGRLDSDDLPLEDSLELFEKGIKLSRVCSKKLAEAQKKVDRLLKELAEDPESETAA
jgi:exodeoxyribonuclease VII small subunit